MSLSIREPCLFMLLTVSCRDLWRNSLYLWGCVLSWTVYMSPL